MFGIKKDVKRDDNYRIVYHSNGNIHIREQIIGNMRNGTFEEFYSLGQKHVVGNMSNGKKQGVFEIFSESGKLLAKYNFANDELNGEYIRYFEDGRLLSHTFFHRGVDLNVNPTVLSEKDKTYIALCGRLPPSITEI